MTSFGSHGRCHDSSEPQNEKRTAASLASSIFQVTSYILKPRSPAAIGPGYANGDSEMRRAPDRGPPLAVRAISDESRRAARKPAASATGSEPEGGQLRRRLRSRRSMWTRAPASEGGSSGQLEAATPAEFEVRGARPLHSETGVQPQGPAHVLKRAPVTGRRLGLGPHAPSQWPRPVQTRCLNQAPPLRRQDAGLSSLAARGCGHCLPVPPSLALQLATGTGTGSLRLSMAPTAPTAAGRSMRRDTLVSGPSPGGKGPASVARVALIGL